MKRCVAIFAFLGLLAVASAKSAAPAICTSADWATLTDEQVTADTELQTKALEKSADCLGGGCPLVSVVVQKACTKETPVVDDPTQITVAVAYAAKVQTKCVGSKGRTYNTFFQGDYKYAKAAPVA